MNKTFKSFLLEKIKISLKNPLFYICGIVFTVFIYFNFFISQRFFSGTSTTNLLLYFSKVPFVSLIIIPVLCFKSCDDIYEKFIPLSRCKIILAKFLSTFIFYVILLLLIIPGCLFVNIFGTVDFGQIFTSFICLIFYGAALISFTLFINQLISTPIAALFVNIIFQTVFNSIHLLFVYINIPKFIENLIKYLSFTWHFDSASKGILDSRDFIFLICNAALFLIFAILLKEKSDGKKFSKTQKSKIFAEILILLLLILNSFKIYNKIDLSKNKIFSFSKYTKELEKKISSPLKITYYRSRTLNQLYPQIKDVSDYLSLYASQNKNVSLQIVNPDSSQEIQSLLESYNITSQSFRTLKNTSVEYINVFSAVTLEYEGKIEVINFILGTESLEYDLDVRIKKLISNTELPVNIIIGNGMNFYSDYSYLISWFSSQGFSPNPIFITDPDFAKILQNSTGPLFVIGDSQINVEKAIVIEDYILSGKGNGLFNISPFSAKISQDWSILPNEKTNLIEMLENWGIEFTNNFAADISCSTITFSSESDSSDPFANTQNYTEVLNYPLWINLLPQENCKTGITLFWPVELKLNNENVKPLLVSSNQAYSYNADLRNSESVINTNPFELRNENLKNKERKILILGAEISGKLEGLYNYKSVENSKVIVIPDQYFVNSLMNGYISQDYGDYRNFDFVTNLILNLSNENELSNIHNRSMFDNSLNKITDLNSFVKLQLFTYIFLFIVEPLLIIIAFIILKIVLRKKDEIQIK